MKQTIYILTLLLLASCRQPNSDQTTSNTSDTTSIIQNPTDHQNLKENENSEEYNRKKSLSGFEKATLYKLADTLTADFNGDGTIDRAFYKKENETSGIIIIHGQTNEEIRIGFGKQFAEMGDFNWVDYWGLVQDKETSETTFSDDGEVIGSRDVKLQNPSIVLGKDEVGGGLITYLNGKYEWIHQTC